MSNVIINPFVFGAAPLLGDIDLGQSINDNLIWCLGSHPSGSSLLGTELVARTAGTLNGTAALDADHPDESWKSLDLPVLDDNWTADITSAFETALEGSNTYSYALYATIVAMDSFGTFFNIPWDDGWSEPFASLGFLRNSSSNTAVRTRFTDSSDNRDDTTSDAGDMLVTDSSPHWMVVVRNGTSHKFYLDGTELADVSSGSGGLSFNASGTERVVIGTRNDTTAAESVTMELYSLSIWDGVLTPTEVGDLNTTPTLQFFT